MMKPRFTIGMLGGACEAGAEEAGRLFHRGRHYTVQDTIDAGASPQNVVWLLMRRSKECGETLDFMKAWARSACEAAGIKPKRKIKTGEDAFAVVKDAMRARNKAAGSSRGGKAWAYDQLRALAAAEGKDDNGTG